MSMQNYGFLSHPIINFFHGLFRDLKFGKSELSHELMKKGPRISEKTFNFFTGEAATLERKMLFSVWEPWHRRYLIVFFDSTNGPDVRFVKRVWEV